MRKWLLILMCVGIAPMGLAQEPDAILGVWDTEDNESKVEIFKCGDAYCAKIIEIEEKLYPEGDPHGMAGQPKVDRLNPDETKRKDSIVGLQIMSTLKFKKKKKSWIGGKIYNPEDGKTYRCKLSLEDNKILKLRGYLGISLLGQTATWTR